MEVVPYYDRGNLVHITTHTVLENLLTGMLLVVVVLVLFLGNVRVALITALNIPLALLVAFSGMVMTGTSANLISIGAIDFGIVVDSTVIMAENVFRHLGSHGQGSMKDRIQTAAAEVGGPMMLSTLIIGVSFVPLFTMTGVTGVIFAPMAHTYAFAIAGAVAFGVTLTPALLSMLIGTDVEDKESALLKRLHRWYDPAFDFAMRRPKSTLVLSLIPILLCVALFPLLGGELMPKLEEGNLWIRATLPTSISPEEASKYVNRMREVIRGCPDDPPCPAASRKYPEIETVVSQLGRPDDGTDVAGFYNAEFFAPLRPFGEWPRGVTKERLTEEIARELEGRFPGVVFNFSQAISDNVEEALSGVKGENSVKVIGPDLTINQARAEDIADVLGAVKGIRDLGVIRSLGQPNIRITADREAGARYGLNSGDVNDIVQAAIGGKAVTQLFEGERRFDVVVRWLESYRSSVRAMSEIQVSTPEGQQIPLGQLASITKEVGPSVIYREDSHRYTPVKFSVRGRDLQSTIAEAQREVNRKVRLPYDTHLEWAGQIGELKAALRRLSIIIPITFALILLLAYVAVRTWIDTVIVFVSILVGCTGGVLALLVTGINFSVSAAKGFVSIFGLAILGAILVVTYYQRLRRDGLSVEDAARGAAEKRFRPVLMTTLVATLGLLPAALSNGIGAQTQKPLAVVVIGGSLILAALTRIIQPSLLVLAHRSGDSKQDAPA
jgi:cobalt-zinc-cadmium resistance protein CzcA